MAFALKGYTHNSVSVISGATSVPVSLVATTGSNPVTGDTVYVMASTGATATIGVPTLPAGWSWILSPTTSGTMTGWIMAGPYPGGTTLTITLSNVTATYDLTYQMGVLDGTIYSGFGTAGSLSNRGGVSGSTIVCAAAGSTGNDVACFAMEKASAHSTCTVAGATTTVIDWGFKTGTSTPAVAVAGYTASGGTASATFTFSTASGNGLGLEVPLTLVPAGTAASGSASITFSASGAATAPASSSAAVSFNATASGPAISSNTATIVISASGAAGATAAATAAVTFTATGAAGIPVVFPQAGGVSPSGFEVRFATTNVGSARVAVSTSSSMTSPSYSGTITPDADGIVAASFSSLSADTDYWYAIEANGTLLTGAGQVGSVHTYPTVGVATNFSFVFGTCQFTDSNHAVFTTIKNHTTTYRRLGLLHLGDLHYRDWQTNGITSAATIKAQQKSSTQQPNFAALLAAMPWDYIWDNHDWGGAASDSTNAAAATLEAMYRQMLPHYPMLTDTDDNSGAIDHVWQIGRVAFYAMDTRSQRSPSANTDNSSKTMLGAGQKARLKTWMSTNTAPVKILVLGIPWKNYGGPTGDRWGAYLTEFGEMATYFAANGIGKLYAVSGDIHSNGADDGTNESFGHVPNAVASCFDQSGTSSASGWSQGVYPASGTNTNHLFATLNVADTGSQITVSFTGYDSSDVSNITMTTTFTTSAPSSGTAAISFSASGAAVAKPTATAAVSFTGSAAGTAAATASASISFTGTGATTLPAASGAVTFTATGAAKAAIAAATASIAFSSTGVTSSSAAASVSFNATAPAKGVAAATGAIAFSASGITSIPASSGAVAFTATGVSAAVAVASASIVVSGGTTLFAPVTASAAIVFTGGWTIGANPASGTASIVFASSGISQGSLGAAASILFTASSVVAVAATASALLSFTATAIGKGVAAAVGSTVFTGSLVAAVSTGSTAVIVVSASVNVPGSASSFASMAFTASGAGKAASTSISASMTFSASGGFQVLAQATAFVSYLASMVTSSQATALASISFTAVLATSYLDITVTMTFRATDDYLVRFGSDRWSFAMSPSTDTIFR